MLQNILFLVALHPEDLYSMESVGKLKKELKPPERNTLIIQSRPGEHKLADLLTETLTSHVYRFFTEKGKDAPSVELQRIEANNLPFTAVANANYKDNHIVGLASILKEEGGSNQDYNIIIHSDKGITLRMGRRSSQIMDENPIRLKINHSKEKTSLHIFKGYTQITPEEIELEADKLKEMERKFREMFTRLKVPIKHATAETILDPIKPEYYDIMIHLEGERVPEELVYILEEFKNVIRQHLRYGDFDEASDRIKDVLKKMDQK